MIRRLMDRWLDWEEVRALRRWAKRRGEFNVWAKRTFHLIDERHKPPPKR